MHLIRGRPRFKIWLPDSRAHLHHKILKELNKMGKMTKWRDRRVFLFIAKFMMKKFIKAPMLRILSEIRTYTFHSIQFIVNIHGIPNIFKKQCQLLGKIQEIYLFDFISLGGTRPFSDSLMPQEKMQILSLALRPFMV